MAVPKPVVWIGWGAVGLFAMGAGPTAISLLSTSSNAVTETGGAAVVILPDSIDGFERGQQYAQDYIKNKGADAPEAEGR